MILVGRTPEFGKHFIGPKADTRVRNEGLVSHNFVIFVSGYIFLFSLFSGQYMCDSACPEYEALDPVTNQCVPVYCSAASACANAGPDRQCLRMQIACPPGRPCSQFRCCQSIEQCSSLYCAFGNLLGPDGCPTCDCNACYGPHAAWGGGGGSGLLVARKFRIETVLLFCCCLAAIAVTKQALM